MRRRLPTLIEWIFSAAISRWMVLGWTLRSAAASWTERYAGEVRVAI